MILSVGRCWRRCIADQVAKAELVRQQHRLVEPLQPLIVNILGTPCNVLLPCCNEVRSDQVIEPGTFDLVPQKVRLDDVFCLFAGVLALVEYHAAEEVNLGVDLA